MNDLVDSNGSSIVTAPEAPRVSSQDRIMALVQKRWPQYHPVVAMVDLAHSTDDETIELNCHKEVAKYVVAVDKYVEIKSETKQTRRVVVELFGGPDQQRADGTVAPALRDDRSVSDAVDKLEQRDVRTRVSVVESGPVEEGNEGRDRLAQAWGDGSAVGAARFS